MKDFRKIELQDSVGQVNELLTAINDSFGIVPNVYSILANSPSTLAAVLAFGDALGGNSLSPQLKEKIALVVSNENTCQYCVSAHTAIAKTLNMDAAEIVEAQRGKSEDAREQLILDLAISLNSNHGHGDNSAVRAALEAGLSTEEVLEILGEVVKSIITNTVNGIANTEIDFPEVALI